MDDADKEFEAAWAQMQSLVRGVTTAKDIARLFYFKGRVAGIDAGMKIAIPDNGLTPEDAAKLESVTIGEHIDHAHLGDVLRAQKQTG